MRHNKMLRLVVTAIVLALVIVTIPAFPVLGALGNISASSSSGPVGSMVSISGAGFTVDKYYYVRFNMVTVTSGLTGTTGTFYATFYVPELARSPSPYYIDVTTDADTSNTLYFTITPEVILNAASGYVGEPVIISGRGFYASSTISIYFDNVVAGTTTSGPNGTFTNASFTVPPAYRGTHTVSAMDTGGYSPGVTFTVNQKITANPIAGGVGDKTTISGTGFAASSSMSFYWDNAILPAESATTNASGSFTTSTFNIPPSSKGSHTIQAQDAAGNAATATFTIVQKIAIAPTSGIPGTVVTVTGNGFDAGKTITISHNNLPVITTPSPATSNTSGSFTATFTVPAGLPGTFTIEASDGTYKATANFLAITEAKISQITTAASPGYVGMEVTVSGTGFKPGAPVTIYYTTEPVVLATVTTDASGVFSATVKIPPSTGGDHTITATDGTTIKSFPFYMEKNPPPIPQPLLPLNGGKTKPLSQFDWQDVTDPSGLTYTLQVTIDKEFNGIVLEKKGLTKSEYILTETEKLPSNKKSAPYYWRIQAVDSASNVSVWTTPGTFNVGFVLEFTGWMLYAALGIGGGLLILIGFFIGFFSGRRSVAF